MERKFFSVKVLEADESTLTVKHFISTDMQDRSGDIMDPTGMVLDGTPSVLKQHGKDPDTGGEPIAKCLGLEVGVDSEGHKGIIATTQYYDGTNLVPPDNTGRRLFEKARDDFMPYWSIGFAAERWKAIPGGGRHVTKWHLYEYSQVGVPDNVSAKGIKPEDCETLVDFGMEPKGRGDGQGAGGPRQGDGGADECVCPECGATAKHEKGTACTKMKCPKCGAAMTGKSKKKNTKGMEYALTEVNYRALFIIFENFVGELFMLADEKETKKLLKEFVALLEPYAVGLVEGLHVDSEEEGKALREHLEKLRTALITKADDVNAPVQEEEPAPVPSGDEPPAVEEEEDTPPAMPAEEEPEPEPEPASPVEEVKPENPVKGFRLVRTKTVPAPPASNRIRVTGITSHAELAETIKSASQGAAQAELDKAKGRVS